jgi:hypothetical protein
VARSRLVELGGGEVGYSLKKRWRDGTTAVVMTQDVLMERLCAASAAAAATFGDELLGAGAGVVRRRRLPWAALRWSWWPTSFQGVERRSSNWACRWA